MAEFVVELYLSAAQLFTAPDLIGAASRAAADVSRDGQSVRCVRSFVVPEDETCFLLFEARSIDAVREVLGRAGLSAGRVTEAMNLPEKPN